MALDPGLSAVLGAAVGAAGTLLATIVDKVFLRRDRRDDATRADHTRNIEQRESLYVEALELATRASITGLRANLSQESPDLLPQEAERHWRGDLIVSMGTTAAKLDLSAPTAVREPFRALSLFVTSYQMGEPEAVPRDPDALLAQLRDAMRADLRIIEPRVAKVSPRRGR
jgi:hypothetical protein